MRRSIDKQAEHADFTHCLLCCNTLPRPHPVTHSRSLLEPLSWSHVYVPLLPRRMAADLLQCPTPFILGLETATARELELPRDAIQVRWRPEFLVLLRGEAYAGFRLPRRFDLCPRACFFSGKEVHLDTPLLSAFFSSHASRVGISFFFAACSPLNPRRISTLSTLCLCMLSSGL